MGKIKNIIYTFCAALIATACTDGNDWEVDSSHDRLFATSESSFSITPAENAAQAEASWKATPNTTGYVIEVSTNPLSDEVPMGSEGSIVYGNGVEKITKTTYLLENLESETEYYARIKSVGDGKESNWVYYDDGGTFKTKKEQILKTPTEITDSSIKVSWEENCTVTSLRIFNDKGYDQIILLEAAELQSCSITIQGLAEFTEYTIEIYNGDRLRGTIVATTEAGALSLVTVDNVTETTAKVTCESAFNGYTLVKDSSKPTEAEVKINEATTVEITNLSDNTRYTIYLFNEGALVGKGSFTTLRSYPADYQKIEITSDTEFADKIKNASGNVVFVIPEGVEWKLGEVKINENNNLKNFIIWGQGVIKPKLTTTLTIKGDVETAEFYNLNLETEISTDPKGWEKTYTINYQDDKNLGYLKVERCYFGKLGNAVRFKQSSGSIIGIEINDCFFNGFMYSAIMLGELKVEMSGGVKITNSTFVNGQGGSYMFRSKNLAFNFTAENCTFYLTNKNDVYSDDKKGSTFTVKNCLFGGSVSNKINLLSEDGTYDVTDSYSSNDIIWNEDFGVKSISLSTSELFPNMANDNYKAADSYSIYGDQNWN